MKKLIAVLLTGILMLCAAGCYAGSGVPEGFDEAEVIATAKSAVKLLSNGNYEELAAMFSDVMELDAAGIEAALDEQMKQLGSLTDTQVSNTYCGGDEKIGVFAVTLLTCTHQNGRAQYTISVDSAGMICGLFVKRLGN